ncbi:acetyltransferase [Algibacter sp. L4_22]|uniref:acetyltransferase n=1 Tax=Algibacter sp. L4_22 TaxID=2942477 RepID=UPI00201B650A|nr:acetyltransferase [Algibacter sp. L4_22]MCL5127253.1 acetyltransferase [Algibacter sp. L4_22]
MKKLIIIGGYGNGTVVQSTVEDINDVKPEWEILGFLNDKEKDSINGYPVLGAIDKETVNKYLNDPDVYFFYSLISVKLNHKFLYKLQDLEIPTNRFATIIHPTAVVAKTAKIGYGVCIQPFVSVGPNTIIGNYIHIFAQSLIGHGSTLDDYSYVANNACIGADVHLKEGAYLGTNATTLEYVTLGKWSITGIGAVVLKNVEDYAKVVGSPARVIGTTK